MIFFTPGKQRNGVYKNALSALDWDTLYDNLDGGEFLDALRAELKSTYDYVLIDSRTGLSDIADICTLHLPDMVVDCFTLSTQGIEGAARVARQIQEYTERDIEILPVPMRIDHSREHNVVAGLEFAEPSSPGCPRTCRRSATQYWAEVQVPYLPAYAYEETLAAFGDRPGTATRCCSSYERIAARITGNDVTSLPPRQEWLRLRTWRMFARTPSAGLPEIVIDFSPQDQLWAEWIAAVLAGAGLAARLVGEQSGGSADARRRQPGHRRRVRLLLSRLEDSAAWMRRPRPEACPSCSISVTDMRFPPGALERGARDRPGRPVRDRGGGPPDRPFRRHAVIGSTAGRRRDALSR